MRYKELVEVYTKLEKTTKRLEKTKIISEFLKTVKTEELHTLVLLLEGKIYARNDQNEAGVAARILLKAIAQAVGQSTDPVEAAWKETGDLGLAAEMLLAKKKQNTLFSQELTVRKVSENLRKLAGVEGSGAVDRKIGLITELLSCASGAEGKYIIKTVLTELRVGVGEGVLRDAIIWANFSTEGDIKEVEGALEIGNREGYKEVAAAVQHAYDLTNDFGVVAQIAKEGGVLGLRSVRMKVGTPIKVMLAVKAETIEEGIEVVGTPLEVEFKYDGFRMQIHRDSKGKITLYTRRLEDVTAQFPDVVKMVEEHIKAKEFVLDAEVVGFDPSSKKYVPFQRISQRIKRKYEIEKLAKKLPVEVNVFDVLYFEGEECISLPFEKRRELTERIVEKKEWGIIPAQSRRAENAAEVEAFYKESLAAGNEGVMLKALNAPYKPGSRVGHMVKLKPVMDTLDLVIIGAEWGEGKRSEWLSSYIVACRDENGELYEIGRVSTGLKEKEEEGLSFKEMTSLLMPLITKEKNKEVAVSPKIVIEVDYEEIQKSPTYSSGYALRFPRVKGLREDRDAEDISTIEFVEKLYAKQRQRS